MPDKLKKLTLKIPIKDYQKLKLIAGINNRTIADTALEMICKNINNAEATQRKEVVSDILENLGGELIEAE
ncbi:MAG: hypothetical protein R6U40_08715 [Desulfobacterales bacterium]